MNFSTITLTNQKIDDFAEARNRLLKKAKTDWVLFLDSDEKISEGLKKEIESLAPSNKNGFYIKRKNYFCGIYSGTDRILRLGKKDAGYWTRAVHETWKIEGPLGELKNPITHNTAETVSEMIDKINRYSQMHALANKKEGKKSNLFKIVFYPKLMLFKSLFMGRGVVFSILQAFHSFLAWSNLWLMQNN